MSRLEEIVAELLDSTKALGVWLLGGRIVEDNQGRDDLLAGAVSDPSAMPPTTVRIEGETWLEFVDRQIFAERVGRATLVIVFDGHTSVGLIRLRIRQAKDAIESALATRAD
jgi:hypothetical protein